MKKNVCDLIKIVVVYLIPILLFEQNFNEFYFTTIIIAIPIYYALNHHASYMFILGSLLTFDFINIFICLLIVLSCFILRKLVNSKLALLSQITAYNVFNIIYVFLSGITPSFKLVFLFFISVFLGLGIIYSITYRKNQAFINNNMLFLSFFSILISLGLFNHKYSILFLSMIVFFFGLDRNKYGTFFGLFFFFLKKEGYYLIIGLLSSLPFFPLPGIIYIIADYFLLKQLSTLNLLIILGSSSVLSIIYYLYKEDFTKYPLDEAPVYQNIIRNLNDHVLNYASFLDEFERLYLKNEETKNLFKDSYLLITKNICEACPNNTICFGKMRAETSQFIKEALEYGHDVYIKSKSKSTNEYIKKCIKADSIISLANRIKKEYKLNLEQMRRKSFLETQISGFSNTLRQYAVSLSLKDNLPIISLLKARNRLIKSGFQIILFEIVNSSKENFSIKIGVCNYNNNKEDILKMAIEKEIQTSISIKIKKVVGSIYYLVISPKFKFEIIYGGSSISKSNENLKGDNYTFKNLENGIFYACISDGMGSGKNAYIESTKTLEMIEKISSLESNFDFGMNILNTFYSLKEDSFSYATLDLLSINLSSGKATLYKMGSSTTYIIRGTDLIKIENQNLPFGLVDDVIKEEFDVFDNDLIFLLSDGVNDFIKREKFEKILDQSIMLHPQKISYFILKSILDESKPKDDMTALVLKIKQAV